MAFFIPKNVIEKLKDAEKLNDAVKDIETVQVLAERISNDYQKQIEMFKLQNRHVELMNDVKLAYSNYEKELETLNKLKEATNIFSKKYKSLKNAQRYSEVLNRASNELACQKELKSTYKTLDDITENYKVFDELKKISENFKLSESVEDIVEKNSSAEYLSSFFKNMKQAK
ncbi:MULTISPECIES: hypothetical protein [unclassified Acinetobacter]|uniref:hypothetical protein n=1 Tax=unclassified Acinetobacter TaxID=196816 RepID=UPI0015D2C950|nr:MULTISPECIES: hypothetical protein [unclassified Acinetobacter]